MKKLMMLILIITMSVASMAKSDKIIVGTSGEYYPWAYMDMGNLEGFEIDVWKEISNRLGTELDFKTSRFSGLMGMLETNRIDTVAHQMSITDERKKKFYFTEPYAYSTYDFIAKKDFTFNSLEDVKNSKVGVWLGGNGERTLRKLNKKMNLNLNIITYDGAPLEKEVELGRVDFAWQGAIKTIATINRKNLPLKVLNTKYAYEINAYPFTKTNKNLKLKNEVSKIIKDMHKDGTLSKISIKHFGIDTTTKGTN